MTHLGSDSSSAERSHFSQVPEFRRGQVGLRGIIILIRVPLHLEFSAQSEAKRF